MAVALQKLLAILQHLLQIHGPSQIKQLVELLQGVPLLQAVAWLLDGDRLTIIAKDCEQDPVVFVATGDKGVHEQGCRNWGAGKLGERGHDLDDEVQGRALPSHAVSARENRRAKVLRPAPAHCRGERVGAPHGRNGLDALGGELRHRAQADGAPQKPELGAGRLQRPLLRAGNVTNATDDTERVRERQRFPPRRCKRAFRFG
mmetsp:Transcript_85327/g.236446  ORF Transcript_85327/g.236446 Transcript_85327/m.236446 type:complete len:203 (+) Transcript_85327:58-666(+)